jgi:hypothetical protein
VWSIPAQVIDESLPEDVTFFWQWNACDLDEQYYLLANDDYSFYETVTINSIEEWYEIFPEDFDAFMPSFNGSDNDTDNETEWACYTDYDNGNYTMYCDDYEFTWFEYPDCSYGYNYTIWSVPAQLIDESLPEDVTFYWEWNACDLNEQYYWLADDTYSFYEYVYINSTEEWYEIFPEDFDAFMPSFNGSDNDTDNETGSDECDTTCFSNICEMECDYGTFTWEEFPDCSYGENFNCFVVPLEVVDGEPSYMPEGDWIVNYCYDQCNVTNFYAFIDGYNTDGDYMH